MGATGPDDTKQISGIGLATIPRDRFAGIRPVARSVQPTLRRPVENIGQATLKPVDLTGCTTLTINGDASLGSIMVELLDESGRRVRGFSKDDSIAITGDVLRHPVAWQDKKVADLPSGNYMLRLHLDRATLYAVDLTYDGKNP